MIECRKTNLWHITMDVRTQKDRNAVDLWGNPTPDRSYISMLKTGLPEGYKAPKGRILSLYPSEVEGFVSKEERDFGDHPRSWWRKFAASHGFILSEWKG